MNIQSILNLCIEFALFSSIALYGFLFIAGFINRKHQTVRSDASRAPSGVDMPIVSNTSESINPNTLEDNIVPFNRPQRAAKEPIDYPAMSAPELRQQCQKSGIQWRNAKGKGKHLSKAEMIERLQLQQRSA